MKIFNFIKDAIWFVKALFSEQVSRANIEYTVLAHLKNHPGTRTYDLWNLFNTSYDEDTKEPWVSCGKLYSVLQDIERKGMIACKTSELDNRTKRYWFIQKPIGGE